MTNMRRRFFVMNGSVLTYTSSTQSKLSINPSAFNTTIKSHTYDEVGLIKFNGVLSEIVSQIFNSSDSLLTCVLPTKVTKIGTDAFYSCDSLTSITIPNSITSIGDNAFSFCTNLTSITISNSVTEIGEDGFYYCDSLTSIYCKATTPPALGNTYVFADNGSGRKIYVPYQSLDAYKTATYWSEYADDIIGYDFENDTVVGGA